MIVYIVEDILHFIYKQKLISTKLKNCIQNGYIINKEIFIQEFGKIMKKEKIKNKLFGDDITVINNGYFTNGDLFLIESIFSELGFIKIEFKDIRDYFNISKGVYIEININYLVLYFDKIIYLDLEYFKDIPKLFQYFKDFLQGDVILFGINKCIPLICKNNNNFYYTEDYANYMTYSLLKVNKYGA